MGFFLQIVLRSLILNLRDIFVTHDNGKIKSNNMKYLSKEFNDYSKIAKLLLFSLYTYMYNECQFYKNTTNKNISFF